MLQKEDLERVRWGDEKHCAFGNKVSECAYHAVLHSLLITAVDDSVCLKVALCPLLRLHFPSSSSQKPPFSEGADQGHVLLVDSRFPLMGIQSPFSEVPECPCLLGTFHLL